MVQWANCKSWDSWTEGAENVRRMFNGPRRFPRSCKLNENSLQISMHLICSTEVPFTFEHNLRAHSAFIPSWHKLGGKKRHGRNWGCSIRHHSRTVISNLLSPWNRRLRIVTPRCSKFSSSTSVRVLRRPVRFLSRLSIRQLSNSVHHFLTWCTLFTRPPYTSFNWLWISTGNTRMFANK